MSLRHFTFLHAERLVPIKSGLSLIGRGNGDGIIRGFPLMSFELYSLRVNPLDTRVGLVLSTRTPEENVSLTHHVP